ncbi:hypothetical protein [Actinoplanes sp. TFC3]|uniref:hypothetical protein n=1 Tax=Actinoplanes sp. TFC3 TaxID=1710355 RepID=UPI00083078B4|nr:hypothetical protein [Actinoplanes sp. TFC3]
MTAALLIALLAAFTACAGYVAGRLHQWYVVGVDRDEAYQDGFDKGTRSVFSTAARMIAPRRPVRATARVVAAAEPASVSSSSPSSLSEVDSAGSADAALLGGAALLAAAAAAVNPAGGERPGDSAASASSAELAGPVDHASPAEVADVPSESAQAAAPAKGGRHLVPDELVQAATYRLPPDRVARAKVPGTAAADADGETTTRLAPTIPRPRAS